MTNLIPEIPDDLKKQLYQDSIQNPLQTVSKTFSDVWFLVFGGISHIADKRKIKYSHNLECYQQELSNEINKIPKDKLIEPDIQVTVQALENSKYCIESEELRKMFVNLISKSINADFSDFIHPSFSEIIKQMSSLDAKIIALFKDGSVPGLPVCQYQLPIPGRSSATFPEHIFLEIPHRDIFSLSVSLESLSRLRLLTISYSEYLHDQTQYEKFLSHTFYKDLSTYWSVGKIPIKKGIIKLSPFGRAFVKVCVPD